MMLNNRWVLAAIALVIGFGAGVAGSDAPHVAEAEPERIVETETVEVTPDACLEVFDHIEEYRDISADFADVVSRYPQLVVEAASAFSAPQLRAITRQIRGITTDVKALTVRVQAVNLDLDRVERECRQ